MTKGRMILMTRTQWFNGINPTGYCKSSNFAMLLDGQRDNCAIYAQLPLGHMQTE
jgi:hypothetical protein